MPHTIRKAFDASTITYLGLVAFLVAVKLLFVLFPTAFPRTDQASAFYWTTIFLIALMGLVGLMLSRRIGFPDFWSSEVSNRQRFLIPTIIGLIYGVITVLRDLPSPSPIHLKLPLSLAFYSYGAIFLETMLRLFTIPFLVWLISHLILRRRWQTAVVWLAIIVAALYEPLPFMRDQLANAVGMAKLAVLLPWILQPLFLANVVSGWLFRKYGFLAPLTLRLSFYLVWHIIYGGLISKAA